MKEKRKYEILELIELQEGDWEEHWEQVLGMAAGPLKVGSGKGPQGWWTPWRCT
jgi:hypothetical protein